MANPVIIDVPANVWTRVATNVTAGNVKKMDNRPNKYLETYRMTGNAAPTSQSEGAVCFIVSDAETIASVAGIDVYIMAIGGDGAVRVDLP